MKSFYDIIGVKKSASGGEIKRAYRSKAAKIHPDKGGSHEEMAELSRAYSCLKDPVSRLSYDETGEEPKLNSVDQMACELLIQKFSDLLGKNVDSDVLGRVRRSIGEEIKNAEQTKKQAEAVMKRFSERRGDLTVKKGINLWATLIDQNLKQAQAAVKNCEKNIEFRERALKMLDEYSEIERSTEPTTATAFTYTISFQQGGTGGF